MSFSCFDGVDENLFKTKSWANGYENNIYTKNKLTIGWIGNSNPNAHGINKGFELIKKCIGKVNDRFIFKPQDSFTGFKIPHNKIPKYINNIDIIICFSKYEGTPNQILECSSSGKCWISTDVGIVSELQNTIKDKKCGIIIERSEESLLNALEKLYNNRNLIVEYGTNGRIAIEKKWLWTKQVKQFYKCFNC
jgi:glycosyltransferase involved in cell wall biosynthesis